MRRSDLTLGKIALEKVVLFEEFELQGLWELCHWSLLVGGLLCALIIFESC